MKNWREIEPPFIQNEWVRHLAAISQGGELDPFLEFQIRQAFFGGFAKGIRLGSIDFFSVEDKDMTLRQVKDELKSFSEQSRAVGSISGHGHVNTRQYDE